MLLSPGWAEGFATARSIEVAAETAGASVLPGHPRFQSHPPGGFCTDGVNVHVPAEAWPFATSTGAVGGCPGVCARVATSNKKDVMNQAKKPRNLVVGEPQALGLSQSGWGVAKTESGVTVT